MKMLPSDPEIYRTFYRAIDIPMVNNYMPKDSIKNAKLPPSILHAQDRQTIYNYVDNRKDAKERTIRQMQAMTGVDQLVGQLRQKLKEHKIDDNTIIIFTSDHGVLMGQYGLGGKALNYEACTRVPLIIYNPLLPKNVQGKKHNTLVQTIDLAPTMLSMAQAPIGESYQGKDLTDILMGKEKKIRDYLFTENLWSTFYGNPRIETVQNEEWKYLRYYKNENISSSYAMKVAKEFNVPNIPFVVHDEGMGVYRSYVEAPFNGEKPVYEELYQLTTDTEEAVNLAGNKENNSILEKMRGICDKMVKEARGTGKPHVLRYTAESKEEFDAKERKSTGASTDKTADRQPD
jgi:arylsulfatase A-like enzyme